MLLQSKMLKLNRQKGFSLPELLVVLLIISILVVLALPQLIASRRQFRFAGLQRQLVASLTEARQEAMSQRIPITFRYENSGKRTVVYGGSYGALGDAKNKKTDLAGTGLIDSELVYGRPSGAPSSLTDTSTFTALSSSAVNITFQSDGSVLDASNNPVNNALFFYHSKNSQTTAFAVSVLGAGGRVKLWRYKQSINNYVE